MDELTPHLIAEITADLGLDLPGYRLEPVPGQNEYMIIEEGGGTEAIIGTAYPVPDSSRPDRSRWDLGCRTCLEPIEKTDGGMCLRCRATS